MTFILDPSSRADMLILNSARAAEAERARYVLETRRRSAADAAQNCAECMAGTGVREFADLFNGRDVGPLVALIRDWLLRGGA